MSPQRAIWVPGHGVPETIRSVRFHPAEMLGETEVLSTGSTSASRSSTVELYASNYYGDLEGPMLASHAAAGETEFVFSEKNSPIIPPERALTAIIRDPPAQWLVEIESEFKNIDGTDVTRRVRIDSFGTSRESVGEQTAGRPARLIQNRAA